MTHTSTEQTRKKCTKCNGTGSGKDGWDCLNCSGDGWVFAEPAAARTSTEQQIAAAWNAQADEFNQWSELDLGEKIEWAAKWGASQARKPLSDEQILAAFRSSQKISTDHAGWVREQRIAYGRALEAAHGITQEKQG